MMQPKIYILSAAVHSGKTTALQHWLATGVDAAGILCPDVDDLRIVLDISTQQQVQLQKSVSTHSTDICIGKYVFSADGFAKAQAFLMHAQSAAAKFLVVDEIGKLELNGKGLEPALSQILKNYREHSQHLLLVVRDYLLEDVIAHYELQEAIVIGKGELLSLQYGA
jgi:nucleoside-triphosphatase